MLSTLGLSRGERQPISVAPALRDSALLPFRLPVALARAATVRSLESPRLFVWVVLPLTLAWWGSLALEALGLLLGRFARATA